MSLTRGCFSLRSLNLFVRIKDDTGRIESDTYSFVRDRSLTSRSADKHVIRVYSIYLIHNIGIPRFFQSSTLESVARQLEQHFIFTPCLQL